MTYLHRSVQDLLASLSDPAPTPGGGSASALAGAAGLSLLAMVAQMGRTRSGSEAARQALDQAAAALLPLRDHVAGLIDGDARAYDGVVAAYRLPRTSDPERASRAAAIQGALRGAAEVPLDVMRACQAGLAAAVEVGRHGNPAAASDVGVAIELLGTGLRGAALNVRANLGAIDEAGWVEGVRAEVDRLEAALPVLSDDVRAALA